MLEDMKAKLDDSDDVFILKNLALEVPSMSFYFEGGLQSLVKFQNQLLKPFTKIFFM
jgi:hypothetical protein